jgi:hypothetical protein
MNKLAFSAILASALIWTTPTFAAAGGSCHFHGSKQAPEATVVGCANQRKDTLIESGKLDKTWQAVKHDQVQLSNGAKGMEWRVTFKNTAVQDKSKETLYMFFTPVGNFVAANFTGQ